MRFPHSRQRIMRSIFYLIALMPLLVLAIIAFIIWLYIRLNGKLVLVFSNTPWVRWQEMWLEPVGILVVVFGFMGFLVWIMRKVAEEGRV